MQLRKIQASIAKLVKIFWVFPVKKNRVVFRSIQGNNYNCSPKYISEYLHENYPDDFELVWLFKNPKKYEYLKKDGIIVCKELSLKSLYYLTTSGILIDNHGVQSYIPIRKGQTVINTWHGGGSYKKPYANHPAEFLEYVHKMEEKTTKWLSSCQRFSECNLGHIYKSNPDKVLSTGLPRSDIFFAKNDEITRKVKSALNIDNDKKIILYAPTYRDDAKDEDYLLDVKRVISACEKRFGGKFVLAIRFHHYITKSHSAGNDVINVSDYDDMQELIYASDVMITDYSSCIWDACLSHLPCFVYARDLQKYLLDRNFYTPISEWPFPMAEDFQQLVENIENFDYDKYCIAVDEHKKALGSFENGTACKQVSEYLLSLI
jgi:CDP-glycerol glycerophosphotransferase